MGRNAGILLSHNPSAEPGHSFTSVSLLPRQHLGWVWWWMHTCTKRHTHSCIYALVYTQTYTSTRSCSNLLNATAMNLSTHIDTNSDETGEFMYAAETALSVYGRYILSAPCSKTNLLLSLLHSQHMLLCSFVLKGEQTSLSSACIFLLIQTIGLQTHKDHGKQRWRIRYKSSSTFWSIDKVSQAF